MCGIAGFVGWQGERTRDALSSAATRMADCLRHRGPDAGGVWCDPLHGVGLGHRRLSIVDLTDTGRQPMVSHSGRFVIVFNGEIYNFLDLRSGLERHGAKFRGRSDTEVLLAGAEYWGPEEVVRRSVGMFAMAFWDCREKSLHLFRDRMGEKPLYYGYCGGAFVFSSELKALRGLPGWRGGVDIDALALYLRFGYIPDPYAVYKGIYKLGPGCGLTLKSAEIERRVGIAPELPGAAGGVVTPRPYWSLRTVAEDPPENFPRSLPEHLDALDAKLRLAVKRQMVADVPLGAFLSGGIDSSTIVALMQFQSPRPVKTFTISFGEKDFDEGPFARQIARHLGTDHTEAVLSPEDALKVIPLLPTMYDEPFADPSQIPTYLISRVARQHVTVCLSGDGGDEIFGGYNRYFWLQRAWRWARRVPATARRSFAKAILSVGNDSWDRLYLRLNATGNWRQPDLGFKLQKLALALPEESYAGMYRALLSCWQHPGAFLGVRPEPKTLIADDQGLSAPRDPISTLLLWDSLFYLPGDNLAKVDRASMAVSLEMRAPLLDHAVVEQVWSMPESLRVGQGQSKWLLRQVLYRYVPRGLIERPKRGFSVPIAAWLRGPLRAWAEEVLFGDSSADGGLIDNRVVRARWHEHLVGRRDWHLGLWALINLRAWQTAERS